MRLFSAPASRAAVLAAAAVAGLATLAGCSGPHKAAAADPDRAVLTRNERVYNGQIQPGVAGGGGNEVYHGGGDNPSNPDPAGHTGGNEPAPVLVNPVGLHDRFASGQVAGQHGGSVTAGCKSGEQAVGGGYAFTANAYGNTLAPRVPADLYPVLENYPSAATAWTASIVNRSNSTVLLTVHVVCADRAVGVHIATGSGTVGTSDPASAACPGDAPVLTSGGWRIATTSHASQVVAVISSNPGSGTSSWQVRTRIPVGSTVSTASRVTAYAMCAASPLGRGSTTSASVDVPRGGSDTATSAEGRVACRRGELPTAGGFVVDADHATSVTSTFPTYGDNTYWGTTVVSLPGQGYNDGAHATLMAVCVTVV